jgi:hypothetical protein
MNARRHEKGSPLAADAGSAMVGAQIILFSLIIGPLMWLAGDVGRSVSYRTTAKEVAFEAARAGVQQVDLDVADGGIDAHAGLDTAGVVAAVNSSASESLARLGLRGRVAELEIGIDWVLVGIEILDGERSAFGRAGAYLEDR